MSPQCMHVLHAVEVPWPSAGYPVLVRAGSLVSIDMGKAALVAAFGGSGNLEDVIAGRRPALPSQEGGSANAYTPLSPPA